MDSAPNLGAARPLTLTTNPRLDAALAEGWPAWAAAARATGATAVAGWLARRADEPELRDEVLPLLRPALAMDDENGNLDHDAAVEARIELAELLEGVDDRLTDALWEGVLAAARDAADGDAVAEATGRLAALAENHGDPRAAAEYHIEFLNWRRQEEAASDPEAVETAFAEIVRLAERDGNPNAAAVYAYRQAAFSRLAESGDDRAVAGDWERDPAPYAAWA